jgi:hypothetical protein
LVREQLAEFDQALVLLDDSVVANSLFGAFEQLGRSQFGKVRHLVLWKELAEVFDLYMQLSQCACEYTSHD